MLLMLPLLQILDNAVILGAGPIGLIIAQLAKVFGAASTFITDISERNLEIANEVGVDYTLKIEDGGKSPYNTQILFV